MHVHYRQAVHCFRLLSLMNRNTQQVCRDATLALLTSADDARQDSRHFRYVVTYLEACHKQFTVARSGLTRLNAHDACHCCHTQLPATCNAHNIFRAVLRTCLLWPRSLLHNSPPGQSAYTHLLTLSSCKTFCCVLQAQRPVCSLAIL